MNNIQASCANIFKVSFVLVVVLPAMVLSECTCDVEESGEQNKGEALKYKVAALAAILVAGALGVGLPLLSRKVPKLSPENDVFFMIKAFAAGVILATAFIHILPNAFEKLTSPCLKQNPWGKFPFSGFVAMMSSILTLMMESFATGFYERLHANKSKRVSRDEEEGDGHSAHTPVPKRSTTGHAHGSDLPEEDLGTSELIRMRIISQVLELGVVVHSVIIGMSLGACQIPETIKPLLIALSFHQFFEGLGLGGSICQAKFKSRSMAIMATLFSLTTPVGIAIGISITSVYRASSPAALIVEGTLDSASAGILIYMALVDLLAEDFMSPRMKTNLRIQLGAYISLLLGAGCMSVLAKWA